MSWEYESGIEVADRLGLLVPHGIAAAAEEGLLQGKVRCRSEQRSASLGALVRL
jgi:hypothetical protein